MKTALGSPEPEDNDPRGYPTGADEQGEYFDVPDGPDGYGRKRVLRKWDHRGNIAHEHIGGMHESEALGYEERCPDCKTDWDKRRGLH